MRATRCRGHQQGFTLVELMVTLTLLGLMAMLAAPLAENAVQRGKEQALRQALREIRGALDRYKAAADQGLIERRAGDSGYPPDLETLATGAINQRSPDRARIYFLRRVPRDPFAPADAGTDAASWGLRSYASPADAPQPGADVFDVYSRAAGSGLNGLPYRVW